MKLERTRTEYAVEISTDEMLALLRAEESSGAPCMERTLLDKLEALPGVARVEYDGHFGAAVYLRLDFDEDNAANRRRIVRVIRDHLSVCQSVA